MTEEVKKETRGRKAFVPNEKQRLEVQIMASCGFPQEYMCERVINPIFGKPISVKTLEKVFRKELDEGLKQANAMVAQSLFKKALGDGKGAVSAAIWWEKTRGGLKDTSRVEHTGADGKPLESKTTLSDEQVVQIADQVRKKGEQLDEEY